MKRLEKTDLTYMLILYYIWNMVNYYSKMFQIDAGDNPVRVIANLMQHEGYSSIRFAFPKLLESETKYSPLEMKHIYNDYIRYALLPSKRLLKPYTAGKYFFEVIEPLYVSLVFEDDSYVNIDVIYIDNNVAYHVVREDEKRDALEEIKI